MTSEPDGWDTEPRDGRGRLPTVYSDYMYNDCKYSDGTYSDGGWPPMCAVGWQFAPFIFCDGKKGHPPPHRHYSAAGRAEWQNATTSEFDPVTITVTSTGFNATTNPRPRRGKHE